MTQKEHIPESDLLQFSGSELIRLERRRQQISEAHTTEQDDSLPIGKLAALACCYALDNDCIDPVRVRHKVIPADWVRVYKPQCYGKSQDQPIERIRDLIKAGALIAAEIEKLQRFVQNK